MLKRGPCLQLGQSLQGACDIALLHEVTPDTYIHTKCPSVVPAPPAACPPVQPCAVPACVHAAACR